jgi:hypothetical protein
MKEEITVLIVLLLLDIALTLRSTMIGLYSSVWSAEGKFGLISCYANSLNVLSSMLLFCAFVFGILYLKSISIKKFLNEFLIIFFIFLGILFFYFWIACDLNLIFLN